MASTPQHWDAAYAQGDTTRGWYQSQARVSMELLGQAGVPTSASIIDIGGGASGFVDDLLRAEIDDVTVLDHSPIGLDIARARLGSPSERVTWIVHDLLTWTPPRRFDVWHDRAVLHFLLDDDEQSRYADVLRSATHPGSIAIIGVFGPTGPQMCSGLPVQRYDAAALDTLLAPTFQRIATRDDVHTKPDGSTQDYVWWVGRRGDPSGS